MAWKSVEARREYQRKWQAANKDKMAQYAKTYWETHHDRKLEQCRRWHADNIDKVKAIREKYMETNRDRLNEQTRAYKRAHKRESRDRTLRADFGITLADYELMLVAQSGGCAICGKSGKKSLAVDHCHSTGIVRGLLCNSCNVAIGLFRDDAKLMNKAIAYVERAQAAAETLAGYIVTEPV